MMTTIPFNYYLLFRLKWSQWASDRHWPVQVIETSFFIANVAKIRERWMFLFFELFIFMTMYTWYYARKINNRLVKFTDLGRYTPQLIELSGDDSIPKFSRILFTSVRPTAAN